MTYLRKMMHSSICEKWEKQLWKQQGSGKRRCSRHLSRDSPAAHGDVHGDAGCPPAAHGVLYQSVSPRCSPWRSPCSSRWMYPEGSCSPWRGAYTGAGGLAGAVTNGGPVLDRCTLWYGSILEQFLQNFCLWEAHVWEGQHPVGEDPTLEQGKSED